MNHPFTLHRMCAKGHQLATALYSLARLELNGLVSTWQDPISYGAGFDKNVSEVCPPPQQVVWNSGILRLLQILNMIHSDRWLYRAVLLHGFDIFWSWSWPLWPRGASKFGGSLASWSATPTESIGTWCNFSYGSFARNLDQGFGNPTVSWCWLGLICKFYGFFIPLQEIERGSKGLFIVLHCSFPGYRQYQIISTPMIVR